MNTKADKIALLKEIALGKIKPSEVPADPIVISKREEMYYGLMMKSPRVVLIGEAERAFNELMQSIDNDH